MLVPPTDPVGRTPLIEEEDAVPLVRHVLRSQANTSGFAETKPLTQPVFESKSDQKSRSLNMTCKEVEVRGFLHGFDKSSRIGRRGRNVTFSNVCKDRCVFLRHLRRNIIPALLQTLLIAGPSVEVGVWKGDYSSVILNGWRGTQSHTLVDPYKQPGGIIAGHDFTHLPLARAVVKFLRIHARTAKIYVTPDHPASWIVAKC